MAGGGEGTVLGYGQTEAGAGALDQSGSWRRFPDSAAYLTSMAQVGSRTLAQVDALLLLGEVDALRSGSGRRRWTRCAVGRGGAGGRAAAPRGRHQSIKP